MAFEDHVPAFLILELGSKAGELIEKFRSTPAKFICIEWTPRTFELQRTHLKTFFSAPLDSPGVNILAVRICLKFTTWSPLNFFVYGPISIEFFSAES